LRSAAQASSHLARPPGRSLGACNRARERLGPSHRRSPFQVGRSPAQPPRAPPGDLLLSRSQLGPLGVRGWHDDMMARRDQRTGPPPPLARGLRRGRDMVSTGSDGNRKHILHSILGGWRRGRRASDAPGASRRIAQGGSGGVGCSGGVLRSCHALSTTCVRTRRPLSLSTARVQLLACTSSPRYRSMVVLLV